MRQELRSSRSNRARPGGHLGTNPVHQAGAGMNRRERPPESVGQSILLVQISTALEAPIQVSRDGSPTRQNVFKLTRRQMTHQSLPVNPISLAYDRR